MIEIKRTLAELASTFPVHFYIWLAKGRSQVLRMAPTDSQNSFAPFSSMTAAFTSLKSTLNTFGEALIDHPIDISFFFLLSPILLSQSLLHLRMTTVVFLLGCKSSFLTSHQNTWMSICKNRIIFGFRSVSHCDGESVMKQNNSYRGGQKQRIAIGNGQGQVLTRICSHPH